MITEAVAELVERPAQRDTNRGSLQFQHIGDLFVLQAAEKAQRDDRLLAVG
jgi:hypothetical protein